MRRGRVLTWAVAVLAIIGLLGARDPLGATTSTPDISGNWFCCQAGGASPQIWIINGTTGTLELPSGEVIGTSVITQHGDQVTVVHTYLASFYAGYVSTFVGVVSPNGQTITGTWTSNHGQSGTFTATRGTFQPYVLGLTEAKKKVTVKHSTTVTVAVTAEADSLTAVAVNGLSITSGSATVTNPATPLSGFSLAEGTTQTFVFAVRPTLPGPIGISATVSGDDAAGAFSQTVTGTITALKAPKKVHHTVVVAPIATSLGTPREIFHSMSHNVQNAAITIGVILLITFPSNIFNSTFSAHYEEIAGYAERVRRKLRLRHRRDPKTPDPDRPGRSSVLWFTLVLVAGAVLGALLNPKFGLNSSTASGLGATLVAFAFGAAVSWFVTKRFRRWHQYPTATYLKALPLGLVVAGICVLISRSTGFVPGYLYGVVVSVSFAESIADRHNAHLSAISTLTTLVVALVAWFIWVPVNHLALTHVGNVPFAVCDDVLGSIFVGGLVGSVFGLLPLALLPGRAIASWRRDAWALLFFVAVFLLVEVELRPAAGPTHPAGASWVTAGALFVFFGGSTILMRRYFGRRTPAVASAAVPAPTNPPDLATVDDQVDE